ncbi:MAG: DUF6531 domain-containing protein [Candidatus Sumerlaeia bacterium]|nr:DUF6531 domain-containing protein [Candidatus Sumerlaeia bacterium]
MALLESRRVTILALLAVLASAVPDASRRACAGMFGETLAERLEILPRDGSLCYGESDIEMNATGFALALRRSYCSTHTLEGVFGRGWSSLLDTRIELHGRHATLPLPDRVLLRDEFGNATVFLPLRSGLFHSQTGRPQWLLLEPDGALLRDQHGRYLAFNAKGRLSGLYNAAMVGIEIEYDGERVVAMRDAGGRAIRFTTDRTGRILEAQSTAGHRIRYEYVQNWLLRVTDATGVRAEYLCDERGRLNTIIFGGAERAEIRYDDTGRVSEVGGSAAVPRVVRYRETTLPSRARVTEISDAFGRVMRYRFRDDPLECQITLPTGGVATVRYNARRLPVRMELPQNRRLDFDYDQRGNLTRLALPGGTTFAFGYSSRGELIRWTRADGAGFIIERTPTGMISGLVSTGGAFVRRMGFDVFGRIAWMADGAPDRTMLFSRNARGDLTTITAPAADCPLAWDSDAAGWISRIAPTGRPALHLVSDLNGRPEALADSLGSRLELRRDRLGRLTGIEDCEKNAERIERDAAGRPQLWRRADGAEVRLAFDREGNIGRVLLPEGNECRLTYDVRNLATSDTWAGVQRQVQYDDFGCVINRRMPSGRSARVAYDSAGRLAEFRPDSQNIWRIQQGLDGCVRRLQSRTEDFHFGNDAAGRPSRLVDNRSGNRAEYEYDTHGRIAALATSDARWVYQYDGRGRLIRVAGDKPASGEIRYVYEASTAPLPSQIFLPGGANVACEYDAYGRRISIRVTLPSGRTAFAERYRFDNRGNLARIEAGGRRTEFVYDAQNRLVALRRDGHEYARLHRGRDGRLLQLEGEAGSLELAYDAAGRPVRSSRGRWEYDQDGQRSLEITPEGATAYRYDPLGRLALVTLPSGLQVSRYYTPNGWLAETGSRGRSVTLFFTGDAPLYGLGRAESASRTFLFDPLWGGVLGLFSPGKSETAFRDALGRLRAVGVEGEQVRDVEWTPLGRLWRPEKQIYHDRLALEALDLDPETGLCGEYEPARAAALTPRSLLEGMSPYTREALCAAPNLSHSGRHGSHEASLLEDIIADCAAGQFAPREPSILRYLLARGSIGWPDIGSEKTFDCLLDGHSFLTPAEIARRVTETVLRDGTGGLRPSAFIAHAAVPPSGIGLGRFRSFGATLAILPPVYVEDPCADDRANRSHPAFAAADNARHAWTGRLIARATDRCAIPVGEDGTLRLLGELAELMHSTAFIGPHEGIYQIPEHSTGDSVHPHPERLARRNRLLETLVSSP